MTDEEINRAIENVRKARFYLGKTENVFSEKKLWTERNKVNDYVRKLQELYKELKKKPWTKRTSITRDLI